jgi:hypothetical protein
MEHSTLCTNSSLPSGESLSIADREIPALREELLIETVKSAFGESRGGLPRKPSDEAWEWILSDRRELPFSFAQCCREVGADPDTMLEWLRYYRQKFMS